VNFFAELKRRNVYKVAIASVIDLPDGCPFRLKVRDRTSPVRTFARGKRIG
jgi:hypothetical protein